MVKTERKAMGKSNKIKNTDRNGILLALEKDLEFIKSVATNHKNWNEETARAVTKLIGWGSVERVLKIGKKARSLKQKNRHTSFSVDLAKTVVAQFVHQTVEQGWATLRVYPELP